MYRAKIIQTQICALARTIDCGAWCTRAHCVVGVGRSVRRTLAPRFTERRSLSPPPLHRSHPSTVHSVSCFSISRPAVEHAPARARTCYSQTHTSTHTNTLARTYKLYAVALY
ncbi:hypothetical protein ACI65C_010821 [Semiaphis heraclei]